MISITQGLVDTQILRSPALTYKIRNFGCGASNLRLTNPLGDSHICSNLRTAGLDALLLCGLIMTGSFYCLIWRNLWSLFSINFHDPHQWLYNRINWELLKMIIIILQMLRTTVGGFYLIETWHQIYFYLQCNSKMQLGFREQWANC